MLLTPVSHHLSVRLTPSKAEERMISKRRDEQIMKNNLDLDVALLLISVFLGRIVRRMELEQCSFKFLFLQIILFLPVRISS